MAMACPQCREIFQQHLKCPKCGVGLLFEANLTFSQIATGRLGDQWQQTPWGRMLVGLLLAQGLAHGLIMLISAGFLATRENQATPHWDTLLGSYLKLGIQSLALLLGGILAGAGKKHAWVFGCVVGLINGSIFLVLQEGRGDFWPDWFQNAQPGFHLLLGGLGGFVGALVWKPLPEIKLPAPLETPEKIRPVPRASSPFAGSIAWIRVLLGIAIAVAGITWSRPILNWVIDSSQGKLAIQSHTQARLLPLEIAALMTLLGAGLAGATTRNGLKQGLIVGLGVCIIFMGIQFGKSTFELENTFLTLLGVWVFSLIGGWFGGQLFPPLIPVNKTIRSMDW